MTLIRLVLTNSVWDFVCLCGCGFVVVVVVFCFVLRMITKLNQTFTLRVT